MTEQDWNDIGRRAVACRGWRWLPGMLARYESDSWCRVTEASSLGLPPRVMPPNSRQAWPDLRDPATVGCLLALVREAWGTAHTRQANHINGPRAWECACNDGDGWTYFTAPAEAHALVAALESAP